MKAIVDPKEAGVFGFLFFERNFRTNVTKGKKSLFPVIIRI